MSEDDLEELYQDIILDHFKHPRCYGKIKDPDSSIDALNPLCGDRLHIDVKLKDKTIQSIRFNGKGCSISQATASLMSELCTGRTVEEVKNLKESFEKMIVDGNQANQSLLKDSSVLQGVHKFPARHRCALLAWQALSDCLYKALIEAEKQNSNT